MSLCLVLQRENEIYMAGDSRVSVDMNGNKYRWHDNYTKIELIGNFVIFKGSLADIMNDIVDKFKESSTKDLTTLQSICKNEYDNYKKTENINNRNMIVSCLIGVFENKQPVVYFISDANNFELMKIELPKDKDMNDIMLGVNINEARKIYETCNFDYYDFDNVFNNYKMIYEGVTGVDIGGTLTVYRIGSNEIELRQCGLMNQDYVNEFADYLLETNYHKVGDMRYRSLANCDELKIRGINALTANDKISVNAIEDLIVGGNVIMGPNATISWNQVTNQPSIPVLPSYIQTTKITSTTIESPTITGGTITGITLQTAGSGNARIKLTSGMGDIEMIDSSNQVMFKIQNDVLGARLWPYAYQHMYIGADGKTVNCSGTWNFAGASTSGLTATAVFG